MISIWYANIDFLSNAAIWDKLFVYLFVYVPVVHVLMALPAFLCSFLFALKKLVVSHLSEPLKTVWYIFFPISTTNWIWLNTWTIFITGCSSLAILASHEETAFPFSFNEVISM